MPRKAGSKSFRTSKIAALEVELAEWTGFEQWPYEPDDEADARAYREWLEDGIAELRHRYRNCPIAD